MLLRQFFPIVLAVCATFLILLHAGILKADPRMETRDGFCHFQIDPNDQNVEVFASNCTSSIFVYDNEGNDEADGDAVWWKNYQQGWSPFGMISKLIERRAAGESAPRRCLNQWVTPVPVVRPNRDLLCHIRLTGEQTAYYCALVDSNGNQYTTKFWTQNMKIFANGRVEYELTCRNAQKD